jgi:hypothetical protein
MKFKEFEASTHMALSSDEVYQIASDPKRLDRWIPRDLAPSTGGTEAASAKSKKTGKHSATSGSGGGGGGGMHFEPEQHRIEWSTSQACETWLEVRSAGGESDVTIHLSVPESEASNIEAQRQLEQALQRLELEANRGLNV